MDRGVEVVGAEGWVVEVGRGSVQARAGVAMREKFVIMPGGKGRCKFADFRRGRQEGGLGGLGCCDIPDRNAVPLMPRIWAVRMALEWLVGLAMVG